MCCMDLEVWIKSAIASASSCSSVAGGCFLLATMLAWRRFLLLPGFEGESRPLNPFKKPVWKPACFFFLVFFLLAVWVLVWVLVLVLVLVLAVDSVVDSVVVVESFSLDWLAVLLVNVYK